MTISIVQMVRQTYNLKIYICGGGDTTGEGLS